MKRYASFFITFIFCSFSIAQSIDRKEDEVSFFQSYLKEINPCIRFVLYGASSNSIEALNLNTHSINPSVFYTKNEMYYLALLNYFFVESNAGDSLWLPNQSKYLLYYNIKEKFFTLFLNSINLEKSILDSIKLKDLFMPNKSIYSMTFDHNFNFLYSLSISSKVSGNYPKVDLQINDTTFCFLDLEEKIFYENMLTPTQIDNYSIKIYNYLKSFDKDECKSRRRHSNSGSYYVSQWMKK